MITLEEKLNLFSKHVFDKIQSSSLRKLEKIEEYNKKQLDEHRENIKNEKEEYIKNKIKQEEDKNHKLISKKKGELKKDIILKKNQLFQQLIEDIKDKLREFTDSEGYRNYLIGSLDKGLKEFSTEDSIVVQLLEKDSQRYREDIKDTLKEKGWNEEDISIVDTQEDIIGGLILVDKTTKISLDISLATKLEEHEDYIGKKLYNALEKEGDKDE